MELFIQASQFFLSLSILIILHELGHFIPAKLFKTRVEKFYLFFNPWFSLFKFKRKETEYGIGWIPLGGYVKISGMIDESMDKEQLKQPAQPWEFRSKPAWQRLIMMLGGVLVNFILAFVIYIGILAVWGEEYLPTKNATYGITCDSIALEMGLQNGDKIISVNNQQVESFFQIVPEILLNTPKDIQVERNGENMNIPITQAHINKIIQSNNPAIFAPRFPLVVDVTLKNSIADSIGIQKGDKIMAVNNISTEFYDLFSSQLNAHKGDSICLTINRDGQIKNYNFILPQEGKVGIGFQSFDKYLKLETKNYSFFEAIPAGISKVFNVAGNYFKQFKLLFNPETKAYKSLGGFITIGKLYPSEWNWQIFWGTTAFISLILAIMNLLPIPALDGGHVMFLLYEIITGRKPNEKFLEYAQMVGMILLFSLLILANANDILRYFKL